MPSKIIYSHLLRVESGTSLQQGISSRPSAPIEEWYRSKNRKFQCCKCKHKHRFSTWATKYLKGSSLWFKGKCPSSVGELDNEHFTRFGKKNWSLRGYHLHKRERVREHLHQTSWSSWFWREEAGGSWRDPHSWASHWSLFWSIGTWAPDFWSSSRSVAPFDYAIINHSLSRSFLSRTFTNIYSWL